MPPCPGPLFLQIPGKRPAGRCMGTCALWPCALWGDRVRAKHRSNGKPSTIPPWGAGRADQSQRMRATDPHPLLIGLVPMQTGQVIFASYCCCRRGPRSATRSRKQPITAAHSLVPSCHSDKQAHPASQYPRPRRIPRFRTLRESRRQSPCPRPPHTASNPKIRNRTGTNRANPISSSQANPRQHPASGTYRREPPKPP